MITKHRVEIILPDRLAELADALAVEGWALLAISPHVPDERTVAVFVRTIPEAA